jgi:hypothetical protein
MLEGMPTRDEDTLGGILVLTAQEAIDALEDGTQELSAGYTCDIVDVDGKLFQRNIRANHIAIVDKGRAGSSCRISDEADAVIVDTYPEPMEYDFKNKEAYDNAMICWNEIMTNMDAGSTDDKGKAGGNTGGGSGGAELDGKYSHDEAIALTADEMDATKVALADAQAATEKVEVELERTKLELADAVVAASEGVVERCTAIENARLIADMRDLNDKSVAEIHTLVVTDQMPDKDFKGKSPEFMAAMFEILVDASKGETPMGKLIKQADETHVTVDAVVKYVNPADKKRLEMIARNKGE